MLETLAQRAQETVTEPVESGTPGKVVDTTPDHVEKPLEALEKPYLTEIFGMGEAYSHFDMESLTNEIDGYVKSEMERQGMESSRKSYQEVIDSYLDRLKLPDNVSVYAKTEKVASLMRINCKLLETLKEKEDFLKSDPTTMSSSQLRRYITKPI